MELLCMSFKKFSERSHEYRIKTVFGRVFKTRVIPSRVSRPARQSRVVHVERAMVALGCRVDARWLRRPHIDHAH